MTVDSEGNLYVAQYGAGRVLVYDQNGIPMGEMVLPDEAGLKITNLAFGDDGFLYLTEAGQNQVWRLPVSKFPPEAE